MVCASSLLLQREQHCIGLGAARVCDSFVGAGTRGWALRRQEEAILQMVVMGLFSGPEFCDYTASIGVGVVWGTRQLVMLCLMSDDVDVSTGRRVSTAVVDGRPVDRGG